MGKDDNERILEIMRLLLCSKISDSGRSAESSIEETGKKMRDNNQKVGIISESDIVRADLEMYLLIRERSRLEAQLRPLEPRETVLAGFCEDCENYSNSPSKSSRQMALRRISKVELRITL